MFFSATWKWCNDYSSTKTQDKALRQIEKIKNQDELVRVVMESQFLRGRRKAVEMLTDQKILADIAKHYATGKSTSAYDASVSIAAINKLTDQSVLADIANIKNKGSHAHKICLIAAYKLPDETCAHEILQEQQQIEEERKQKSANMARAQAQRKWEEKERRLQAARPKCPKCGATLVLDSTSSMGHLGFGGSHYVCPKCN
jgi:predicted RNA-binding Zn-ribbon protein involved in translation (DUF1610 family)